MALQGISFFVTKDTKEVFYLDKNLIPIKISEENFDKYIILKNSKKIANRTYQGKFSDMLHGKFNAKASVWYNSEKFMKEIIWRDLRFDLELFINN